MIQKVSWNVFWFTSIGFFQKYCVCVDFFSWIENYFRELKKIFIFCKNLNVCVCRFFFRIINLKYIKILKNLSLKKIFVIWRKFSLFEENFRDLKKIFVNWRKSSWIEENFCILWKFKCEKQLNVIYFSWT